MALRAGYYGVKRRIWEALQATTAKSVQDIENIINYEELTGVKNILDVTAATQEKGGLTFTVNADKSITIGAGTSTSAIYFNLDYVNNSDLTSKNISAFVGKKLKGSISPSNVNVGLAIGYFKADNTYVDRITSDYIYTSGAFEYPSAAVRTKNFLYIANNTTFASDTTIYPMITFEDMSLDYEPYAMTNQQLTVNKLNIKPTTLTNSDDIDLVLDDGWYTWGGSSIPAHWASNSWAVLRVITAIGAKLQIGITQNEIYTRRYGGSPQSWGNWYKFTGTAVTQAKAPEDIAVDPEISDDEPVVVKKSTRKTTKKTEEEE